MQHEDRVENILFYAMQRFSNYTENYDNKHFTVYTKQTSLCGIHIKTAPSSTVPQTKAQTQE